MVCTLAAILSLSNAFAWAQSSTVPDDQQRLQGIWRVREVVGSADERLGLTELKLSFEGGKLLCLARGMPAAELSYSLNSTTGPKQINWIQLVPMPVPKGQKPPAPMKVVVPGIYSFEQDRLKLRFPAALGGRRPADFSVKAGGGVMDYVLVLERDTSGATRDDLKDVRSVAAIRKLGVEVFSDDNHRDVGQRAPLYLKLDVTKGDAHLAEIVPAMKALSRVTGLHLNGSKVTDAGLASLEGIDNIGHINLERTAITDAGLAHLKNMTHLRLLIVSDTNVTDAGVASLKKSLPHLQVTRLSHAEIDSQLAITNAGGVKDVDEHGRLIQIHFTRRLNDFQLLGLQKHLEVWKSTLRSIDLTDCHITDRGLAALTGLTSLRQLTLKDTDVSVAGVKSLTRTVPNLKVKH